MADAPELSVLIPTLDHPHVDRAVAALLSQTEPGSCEVIVADSEEGAWTARVAREAQRNLAVPVTYLREDCAVLHRARLMNAALRAASGQIIVFLAADFTPGENFVRAHRMFHKHRPQTEAVAIGSSQFVAEQSQGRLVRWLEDSGRLFGVQPGVGDANGFFYVGNASVKRDFADRVGPFDEDIPCNAMDDFEIGHRLRRAGMQSYFLPEAMTRHEHWHEFNLKDQTVAMHKLGAGAVVFERKHPGPYEWSATCARSPFSLRADAMFWCILYGLTRRPAYLNRYFLSRREAAFVEGWRWTRLGTSQRITPVVTYTNGP